jgi:carboxylate-amine ligase
LLAEHDTDLPAWARWRDATEEPAWTVGLEEEIMLLDEDAALAYRSDEVLEVLSHGLRPHVSPETHGSALEIKTDPHASTDDTVTQLRELRAQLASELAPMALRTAVAGTHPLAVWQETELSHGARYQRLYGSMRELARREPTFALHVHVAVGDPETAVSVMARLRAHLPLLLALSANSPFWQGRDSGLASVRTPLFQAFPRVGIPRAFRGYRHYVEVVDLLVRSEAIPDPSYLWWDVRLQPSLGTVEVRIMDAQTRVEDSAALLGLIRSLVVAEIRAPAPPDALHDGPEVLSENRFLAARDGMDAFLIDTTVGTRRPARELLAETLAFCRPAAAALGCEPALEAAARLGKATGADRQRERATRGDKLPGVMAMLIADF